MDGGRAACGSGIVVGKPKDGESILPNCARLSVFATSADKESRSSHTKSSSLGLRGGLLIRVDFLRFEAAIILRTGDEKGENKRTRTEIQNSEDNVQSTSTKL